MDLFHRVLVSVLGNCIINDLAAVIVTEAVRGHVARDLDRRCPHLIGNFGSGAREILVEIGGNIIFCPSVIVNSDVDICPHVVIQKIDIKIPCIMNILVIVGQFDDVVFRIGGPAFLICRRSALLVVVVHIDHVIDRLIHVARQRLVRHGGEHLAQSVTLVVDHQDVLGDVVVRGRHISRRREEIFHLLRKVIDRILDLPEIREVGLNGIFTVFDVRFKRTCRVVKCSGHDL